MLFACVSVAPDDEGMPFCQDALLLAGHGSSHYTDAGRLLHRHAEALRTGGHFAEVAVGLLRGAPGMGEALASLCAPVIHVVPCFMEAGYFTRVAVPAALRGHRLRDGQLLHVCPPVGAHAGLARLIEGRALRACGVDPSSLSLVLAGHGSARAPGRFTLLHRHRTTLAAMQRFGQVRVSFLEEPPLLADVLAALRTSPTAVLGLFAGEGGHVRDDLPGLVAAEQACRGTGCPPLWDLGTIADDPALPSIILDLVGAKYGLPPVLATEV
jgi:sirohydrochlorin ferrochelatase